MYRIMRKKRMWENDDAAHGQWPCSSFLSGTPGGRHYCWKRPCKGSIPSPGCRRGGQRVSESEDTVFSSGYDRRDGVQYGKFEHPA